MIVLLIFCSFLFSCIVAAIRVRFYLEIISPFHELRGKGLIFALCLRSDLMVAVVVFVLLSKVPMYGVDYSNLSKRPSSLFYLVELLISLLE